MVGVRFALAALEQERRAEGRVQERRCADPAGVHGDLEILGDEIWRSSESKDGSHARDAFAMSIEQPFYSPRLLWFARDLWEHTFLEQGRAVDGIPDRRREPPAADDLLGLEERQDVFDQLAHFEHFLCLWKCRSMIIRITFRESFIRLRRMSVVCRDTCKWVLLAVVGVSPN